MRGAAHLGLITAVGLLLLMQMDKGYVNLKKTIITGNKDAFQ
jgi:hypothetical protein